MKSSSNSDRAVPSALIIDHLGFSRHGRSIFSDLSLSFQGGEFVGLLGANGAGKSTLLKTLAGFIRPSSGGVSLFDRALTSLSPRQIARYIAYVPQQTQFSFPYTVRRIVEMGTLPHHHSGTASYAMSQAIEDGMACMGLKALSNRKVTMLSGGERQRVMIARAFAQHTPILLLDEPMTGLDYGFQLRLMALLKHCCTEGRLVIMTSHRPEELFNQVNRVLILDEGQITDDGFPESTLTAARLSRLYNVPLHEWDHHGGRGFQLDE
ncbi:Hemin import ATP-binding protein HmuV [Halomonadaceae bacterium LMG 33818]|uniref:ABC transporter ATP-binding protein n=1 Tax=Cernens ardua TaxID=3402176 RepID=UPI003EDC14B6